MRITVVGGGYVGLVTGAGFTNVTGTLDVLVAAKDCGAIATASRVYGGISVIPAPARR